jgi:DNA helicase HerA-like ATPase
MSADGDPTVIGNLRIQATSPKRGRPFDLILPTCVVQTFLCPECPNVHVQLDVGPPITKPGMKVRVGLVITAEAADDLAKMLMFPVAIRPEDSVEGLI